VAIPFLVLILAAIGGNVIQHRLVWSYQTLAPKLSKISPLAGLKRIFSKQALANLTKGLVKLAVVGTVMTVLMWPERGRLEALTRSDTAAIIPVSLTLALKMLGLSSPCSPSWRLPTTCSNTGSGTSGRKCHYES
jgi:flagellar biosynthesis protein FlhB